MSLVLKSRHRDKTGYEIYYSFPYDDKKDHQVDLLKIDVEGSEINITMDMTENNKLNLVEEIFPIGEFKLLCSAHNFLCTVTQNHLHLEATEIMVYCRKK